VVAPMADSEVIQWYRKLLTHSKRLFINLVFVLSPCSLHNKRKCPLSNAVRSSARTSKYYPSSSSLHFWLGENGKSVLLLIIYLRLFTFIYIYLCIYLCICLNDILIDIYLFIYVNADDCIVRIVTRDVCHRISWARIS